MGKTACIVLFCATAAIAASAALGVFQGEIVKPPQTQDSKWLFVQSRNGNLRRVDISKAKVDYDQSIPQARRHKAAKEDLRPSVLVRIVADQDEQGEWQAKNVVILSLEPQHPKGRDEMPTADILTAKTF
jgi:hypothetical protein